jgi:pimeloyl-ACP methyl ester carboxylesterase
MIIQIPLEHFSLEGELNIPDHAKGIIIFAHGSGSSRHSSRNQMVAKKLQEKKFGTLLFDLLTPKEDKNVKNRFDMLLLTQRLVNVTKWVRAGLVNWDSLEMNVGYFGASTGAAAAIIAAAGLPGMVKAVVARGGRPDLADKYLEELQAPTLLQVGEQDTEVLELNRQALERLKCVKALEVIPGATHLFEEPGTLEEVAEKAADWYLQHVAPITYAY